MNRSDEPIDRAALAAELSALAAWWNVREHDEGRSAAATARCNAIVDALTGFDPVEHARANERVRCAECEKTTMGRDVSGIGVGFYMRDTRGLDLCSSECLWRWNVRVEQLNALMDFKCVKAERIAAPSARPSRPPEPDRDDVHGNARDGHGGDR